MRSEHGAVGRPGWGRGGQRLYFIFSFLSWACVFSPTDRSLSPARRVGDGGRGPRRWGLGRVRVYSLLSVADSARSLDPAAED